MKKLVSALLLGGLAVLITLHMTNHSSENPASPAQSQSNSNSNADQILSSKQDNKQTALLKHLQQLTVNSPSSNEPIDHYSHLSDDEKERMMEAIVATDEVYWDKAPQVLEEMLQEQSRNAIWESSIREAADQLLEKSTSAGTNLLDVDCRQSLCKIRFQHDSRELHATFMDGEMDEGPWMSGAGDSLGGGEMNEDGTLESYIYFSNKGDADTFMEMRFRMAANLNS